jgi:hypothetical protein
MLPASSITHDRMTEDGPRSKRVKVENDDDEIIKLDGVEDLANNEVGNVKLEQSKGPSS